VLLGAWGCSSPGAIKRTVVFSPSADMNGGRPVYVLVRAVNEKDFVTDSYGKMADLVFPQGEETSVLQVALIWPEQESLVEVQLPQGKAMAIYCMFTAPGNQWKVLLPPPAKDDRFLAVLEGGSISAKPSD
jgi:hypothetical protein